MAHAGNALDPFVGRGRIVLVLLLAINILNFIDRQLPFILISAIKADLKLTDSQIGLMAGLSFALVYSFAGLGLAYIADRWNSRLLLSLTLAMWSAMTALSGLAQNFGHLLLGRVGVAASEAGCTPAAHAIISRSFTTERRALVLAIFSIGVPIGSMLGLMLGGWINDVANWRSAFFIVGIPGVFLAVLAWMLLPDPGPHAGGASERPHFWDNLRYLFGLKSFRHMAAGSSLYACGSYAMNVFASAFLIRVHGFTTAEAGLGFGIAFGAGGMAGTFAGGVLSDRLGKVDARWHQRIPAIGQLLSFPTAIGAWLVSSPTLCIVLLTLSYTFGLLYFASSFAAAQSLVPDRMRATASATLLFCLTIVGSSVGPVAVGWLSDRLLPTYGALSLRYAMCLMGITILWSAWEFYRASRAMPEDMRRRQAAARDGVPA